MQGHAVSGFRERIARIGDLVCGDFRSIRSKNPLTVSSPEWFVKSAKLLSIREIRGKKEKLMARNTVAIMMRKAPYGSVYTAEGFRSIMGVGVFEMDVRPVFVDDGVYALVKGQDGAALDVKALGDGWGMLEDFGVKTLYVHGPSLVERGLTPTDLTTNVIVLDDAGLAALLADSGAVLPF
jgi:tRNA 2-thiouridine synthesizing protein C